MKPYRSLSSGVLVAVVLVLAGTRPAAGQCACPGDVNGDGLIDASDTGALPPLLVNAVFDACADVNGDGADNGLDVKAFVDAVMGGGGCVGTGACCFEAGGCMVMPVEDCNPATADYLGDGTTCAGGLCDRGACCAPTGECTENVTALHCDAVDGIFHGAGSACLANPCAPFGACCLDAETCNDNMTDADCALAGGVFRGVDSDCAFISCAGLTGACCLNDGTCQDALAQENCDALGGSYQGDNVACTADMCVVGACCFAEMQVCLEGIQPGFCTDLGGTYFGDGSLCEDNLCGDPTGACCVGGDACVPEISAADCAEISGTYQGDMSDCDPLVCQPIASTGACCLPAGCTTGMTEADCLAQSGDYRGDSSGCSPNPCPGETGACCVEGVCYADVLSVECTSAGGNYLGNGETCPHAGCVALAIGSCCLPEGGCEDMTQPACEDAGGGYGGDGSTCFARGGCPVPEPVNPIIQDGTTKALDGKLVNSPGASIVYRVDAAGNHNVTLQIVDGAAVIRTLLNNVAKPGNMDHTEVWDGKKDDATFAAPKKYEIKIQVAGGGMKKRDIFVVRVGVSMMRFIDSSNSASVPMQFHLTQATDRRNSPFNDAWLLRSLDVGGNRRPEAPPRSDYPWQGDGLAATTADHHNYPAAYMRNRKLKIRATTATAGQGFNIPGGSPEVRLKSTFNNGTDHDNIRASTEYEVESVAGILPANVARTTLNHQYELYYKHANGDFRLLGRQDTSHIVYTTFQQSFLPTPPPGFGSPFPSRIPVFIMDVTCMAAAGQVARKAVVDKVFKPGMINTGMRYGELSIPGGGGQVGRDLDSALDYKKAMCGTMAAFFRMMCGAQGISASSNFYNLRNDSDLPFQNQNPAGDDVRVAGSHIHTGVNGISNTVAVLPNTQLIPVGQGLPRQLCIGPGVNGVRNTVPGGDDVIVGQSITTGANGVCNTTRAGDDVQVIANGRGLANVPCVSPGGLFQTGGTPAAPIYSHFQESKWEAIVIKDAGLNRLEHPWNPANWYDVDAGYNGNPASFGLANVTLRNQRRYAFFANGDGHVINFLVDGTDAYLYDASFLTGPVPDPYGRVGGAGVVPDGHKRGPQNNVFRNLYYNAAIDYHQGMVVFNPGAANLIRTLGRFTVKTTLIPNNIPDHELHLHWSVAP